jgi:hypothetical protein
MRDTMPRRAMRGTAALQIKFASNLQDAKFDL